MCIYVYRRHRFRRPPQATDGCSYDETGINVCAHTKEEYCQCLHSLRAVSVGLFCFVFVNYYLFAVRHMCSKTKACWDKTKKTDEIFQLQAILYHREQPLLKPHIQNMITWNCRFPSCNYFSPVIKSLFYNWGKSKHIQTFCGNRICALLVLDKNCLVLLNIWVWKRIKRGFLILLQE